MRSLASNLGSRTSVTGPRVRGLGSVETFSHASINVDVPERLIGAAIMTPRSMVLMFCLVGLVTPALAQRSVAPGREYSRPHTPRPVVLKPARVWDGTGT